MTRSPLPRSGLARRAGPVALLSLALAAGAAVAAGGAMLDRSYRPLAGKTPVNLGARYGGDVVLVVNTASKCGYTPQFEALEGLQAKYKGQGFAVLGFPSGDFKAQEFEDEKQIQEFCTLTYGVKFPMFEKVHVVGEQATPLYKDLAKAAGEAPKWNFHKYLLGRDGRLIASYGSKTTPDDPAVVAAIERALKAPRPQAAKAPVAGTSPRPQVGKAPVAATAPRPQAAKAPATAAVAQPAAAR